MTEYTIRLPSIPDELKGFPIWKLVLGIITCGLILVFVFPPIYLVLMIYFKILERKGIVHKGMNFEKIFRGI